MTAGITTLHVGHLQCTMDGGIPHYRAVRAGPTAPPQKAQLARIGHDPNIVRPAGHLEAECRFANQDEFLIDYMVEREGTDIPEFRWAMANLTITADAVKTQYPLDSPAGIPVGWRHDLAFANPVGRVLAMMVEGDELIGRVKISKAELHHAMPGGEADLRAGLNMGMSIGFLSQAPLEIERNGGTQEDPDTMRYGQISIYEVSLTPLPRLPMAGILAIAGDADGEPEPEK